VLHYIINITIIYLSEAGSLNNRDRWKNVTKAKAVFFYFIDR